MADTSVSTGSDAAPPHGDPKKILDEILMKLKDQSGSMYRNLKLVSQAVDWVPRLSKSADVAGMLDHLYEYNKKTETTLVLLTNLIDYLLKKQCEETDGEVPQPVPPRRPARRPFPSDMSKKCGEVFAAIYTYGVVLAELVVLIRGDDATRDERNVRVIYDRLEAFEPHMRDQMEHLNGLLWYYTTHE